MTRRFWLVVIGIVVLSFPLELSTRAGAQEAFDCSGSPAEAVTKLALPLSKWAQISCTHFGHMLTSREGWVWVRPNGSQNVFIPSQLEVRVPKDTGNSSYFTKIDVAQVKGEEFDSAYKLFHVGFDENEAKPDGYRVDIESISGKKLRLFFFDYDTYAWGMFCRENICDGGTRFMLLDKNNRPTPRRPPI